MPGVCDAALWCPFSHAPSFGTPLLNVFHAPMVNVEKLSRVHRIILFNAGGSFWPLSDAGLAVVRPAWLRLAVLWPRRLSGASFLPSEASCLYIS